MKNQSNAPPTNQGLGPAILSSTNIAAVCHLSTCRLMRLVGEFPIAAMDSNNA